MRKRINKLLHTDNFSYFIRYFAVFTLIFVFMTAIIFQLMRSTMYHGTDEKFDQIKQQPGIVIDFAIARSLAPDLEVLIQSTEDTTASSSPARTDVPKDDFAGENSLRLGSNYHVLLYDKDGQLLNPDNFAGLSDFAFDKSSMGSIKEVTIEGPFGEDDFRYTTIELSEEETAPYSSYSIKYATICVNVSQIKSSIQDYEGTVAIVMASFWLISIGASLYLANLSMKPILASYQKQKDFVENASHELRTPLAVLQNRLEGLFRHPHATILESSESVASSLEEVRNMRLLTTNLLNLARRDDGLKPEISEVQPAFFADIFANYALIAEENDRELTIENHLHQPIRTDKVLVKQLLTILFDNAMKYSDDGGHIKIEAGMKEKTIYFLVADDGIGISSADKKKIFDRFYRVDKARTRQKGGFGLGLSLAKQISDTLQGDILVRDHQPRGTVFEVRLPR